MTTGATPGSLMHDFEVSESEIDARKAFLELGILLSDQQRYAEAILELRHATRLAPDLAQAHYRLSQAYQRTGQKALAAKELELFQRLSSSGAGGYGGNG